MVEDIVDPSNYYPFPTDEVKKGSKPRIIAKMYLNANSPGDNRYLVEATKLIREASIKAEATMSGLHTCETELEHRRRLKWLPKNLFFSLAYELRSLTCSAVGNLGQRRVYSIFCQALRISEDVNSIKVFEKKDKKLNLDRSRQVTPEYRLRKKQLQAGRIIEIREEKLADAKNKLTKDSYKKLDEKVIQLRKCSKCQETGHNSRNPFFHPN